MKNKQAWLAALLLVTLAAPAAAQKVAGLDGDWKGEIATPSGETLRVTIHIQSSAATTTGVLTSLDQNNAQVPVATVTQAGKEVTFTLPAAMASYTGTLADNKLTGTWTQGPAALPLTLVRAAK